MTDHAKEREAICEIGRSLFLRGYAHSSAGNISVRVDDGYLITATEACLGRLEPQEIAWVDASGLLRSGSKPSKTLNLHRRIYEHDRSANAVIHTHSTHLVALTLRGVHHPDCVLPPITPYQVMKVGPVPLIPYTVPGSQEAIALVERQLQEGRFQAVLMERLGPVVWQKSLQAATNVLEELEETARLWLLSQQGAKKLSREQVRELCARFGIQCGQWIQ